MARRPLSLEAITFDLRLAVRSLYRDRGFAVIAVVILTLALALNTTVFTVMDAMLYRGYPHVKANERLVYLQERNAAGMLAITHADIEDWRREATAFEAMAYVGGRSINFRDDTGRAADLYATTVAADAFRVIGVQPAIGRDFEAGDEVEGAPQVAIISHRFWATQFAKRSDIVGSVVRINNVPATIIGVMPEGFDFPTREPIWIPEVRTARHLERGHQSGGFMVVARLRDDATREQARRQLEAINRRLEASFPETNRGVVPSVASHSETVSGRHAAVIWGSLWAGASLVLLIACANIANLTLVRSLARRREYSTKMALGAGAGRLLRQIAIESAALAAVAGALAWRLTAWSVDEWATMTHSRYQILDYRVDSSTATYLLAITIGCGLVLCAAPMFSVIQLGIAGALKPAGRSLSPDARHRRLARGLVAAQMALAIVLLAGSGVLVRSLRNIVGADAGVSDPDHVMMGLLRLPSADYADAEARASYFGRVEASLRTVSGIENVTLATTTPVRGVRLRGLEIDGRPDLAEGERFAAFVGAGPEYFELLRRRPVVGRAFNQDDTAAAPLVAVVNEKFAGKYWPGESAVGKRLRAIDRNTVGEWRIVVGVVPNIMQNDALRQTFQPLVYVPFEQEPRPLAAFFLARTRVPPVSLASAIRDAVQRIDPQVALERFSTLRASFAFERDFMDAEHSELGKYATVGPIFAVIALVLATIGLVAVIAHSVSQRTHEIGVRMAIGAAARDISRMIVREAMIPVGAGVAVGLAGALAVNRLMHSQLVGVSPYDPMTMIATPLVLIAFALLACRLPAGRAARVDPVVALRHE